MNSIDKNDANKLKADTTKLEAASTNSLKQTDSFESDTTYTQQENRETMNICLTGENQSMNDVSSLSTNRLISNIYGEFVAKASSEDRKCLEKHYAEGIEELMNPNKLYDMPLGRILEMISATFFLRGHINERIKPGIVNSVDMKFGGVTMINNQELSAIGQKINNKIQKYSRVTLPEDCWEILRKSNINEERLSMLQALDQEAMKDEKMALIMLKAYLGLGDDEAQAYIQAYNKSMEEIKTNFLDRTFMEIDPVSMSGENLKINIKNSSESFEKLAELIKTKAEEIKQNLLTLHSLVVRTRALEDENKNLFPFVKIKCSDEKTAEEVFESLKSENDLMVVRSDIEKTENSIIIVPKSLADIKGKNMPEMEENLKNSLFGENGKITKKIAHIKEHITYDLKIAGNITK